LCQARDRRANIGIDRGFLMRQRIVLATVYPPWLHANDL